MPSKPEQNTTKTAQVRSFEFPSKRSGIDYEYSLLLRLLEPYQAKLKDHLAGDLLFAALCHVTESHDAPDVKSIESLLTSQVVDVNATQIIVRQWQCLVTALKTRVSTHEIPF